MDKGRELKPEMNGVMASGHVLGLCWGGGTGIYPSRVIVGQNMEEVEKKVEDAFNDGSLDSGFGFEKLLAASIEYSIVYKMEFEGKEYSRTEIIHKMYGIEKYKELLEGE